MRGRKSGREKEIDRRKKEREERDGREKEKASV